MAKLSTLSILTLAGALSLPMALPSATASAQAETSANVPTANARSTGSAQQGQTAEALEIADKVQAVYDQVRDFSANFTQEYSSVSMGSTRRSEGRVFFKKPGKMRWDYAGPNERYLISDGDQLWVYEPEFAQYYNEALADSQLPSALRFLMGEGNLKDEFAIRVRSKDEKQITLELVPKQRNSQFARLHFVVSAESFNVLETTIFDALGNTNRLKFQEVRQNIGLPNSGFNFAPPAGTTRVEAPN